MSLLQGTAVNFLLVDQSDDFAPVRARAQELGLKVAQGDSAVEGIRIVKGAWPGVRTTRGARAGADAGPTGAPWVDSNGWLIRLETALHPEAQVWLDTAPGKDSIVVASSYAMAACDAGAHGGRWILTLDSWLADGLAAKQTQAWETWRRIADSSAFLASHSDWAGYVPIANFGVVSDFTGDNEFFSHELLNLVARTGGQYRILPKGKLTASSFDGLRAVIYADAQPPAPGLRKEILGFVEAGGMLITMPAWGEVPGGTAWPAGQDARYSLRTLGKGRLAMAREAQNDPYVVANDSVLLLSHRYDLVRFWNGGAVGSYYAAAPDRRHAVAHLLFYSNRGPDAASVRIAGPYRTARISTPDSPAPRGVETVVLKDALELHLPQMAQYAAVELAV